MCGRAADTVKTQGIIDGLLWRLFLNDSVRNTSSEVETAYFSVALAATQLKKRRIIYNL